MDRWGVIYKIAWILLLAACLVCLVCVFMPRYSRLMDLQEKLTEAREQNRLLEQKIRSLQEKQVRFETDPEFVEQVSRSEGMAKTNEMVFRLVDGPPPAPEGRRAGNPGRR